MNYILAREAKEEYKSLNFLKIRELGDFSIDMTGSVR